MSVPAAALRRVLVSDRRLCAGEELAPALAERAERSAATAVLLREKDLPDDELLPIARELMSRLRCPLLVAHRPEVAAACGAAGVHLGWTSPTTVEARRILGEGPWIGRSVHAIDEARTEASKGLNYLVFGPVRDTPSKRGLVSARGFEALAEVARSVSIPVVAIGGLGLADEERVRASGAAGFAAIRALMETEH